MSSTTTRPWSRPAFRAYALPRHLAALPADRAAGIPWLIIGDWLITPWPRRRSGLTRGEVDQVHAVQDYIDAARRAGRLPASDAVWIDARTGRCTPQPIASDAWLRAKVAANVTVAVTLRR